MKKKDEHTDYFDIEPKAKQILGAWLSMLFVEGGIVLLLYLLYKILI